MSDESSTVDARRLRQHEYYARHRTEILDSGETLCFDHCHVLLYFRGWLCRKCNWILGIASDDPKRLDALAEYLRRDGNE